jgi:hypothetical protein
MDCQIISDFSGLNKVLKTVRGSIKKSIFYLGVNIPYEQSLFLISPPLLSLNEINQKYQTIFNLISMDYQIRKTDNILDEKLYRIKPLPKKEIIKEINNFEKINDCFVEIASLFKLELILHNKKVKNIRNNIKMMIEIRPCDYFLLIDEIVNSYGSLLSQENLDNSYSFLKEFQRLRDLFDDIMTTEEDENNNSYNSVVLAKKNKINYDFFEKIIDKKFNNLNFYYKKINSHPNKILFKHTIDFWREQYKILFKPLLINYYVDIDKFRRIYFMFKQV